MQMMKHRSFVVIVGAIFPDALRAAWVKGGGAARAGFLQRQHFAASTTRLMVSSSSSNNNNNRVSNLAESNISNDESAAVIPTQVPRKKQGETLLSPSQVSDRVFLEGDERPVILFDGVCNLCNRAVNLALDWDPKGNLRFSALQSAVGRSLLLKNGRRADDISSIVLVDKDGAYIKSDAILKITEELSPSRLLPTRLSARLAQLLVPRLLRDLIYDRVADNRYSFFGKRDVCRFDADGEFEDRFVKDELAYKDD